MNRRDEEDVVLRSIRSFEDEHQESPARVRVGGWIGRALMLSPGTISTQFGGVWVMLDPDLSGDEAISDQFET